MDGRTEVRFDPADVPATPAFVVDEGLVHDNLRILSHVRQRSGAKILLALKAFAMYPMFPLLAEYLDGVCASSPHEARLGREEFGGEVHTFAAGFAGSDVEAVAAVSDHVVFNSFAQYDRFARQAKSVATACGRRLEVGIRVNPEHSEGAVPLYDPCSPGSRLGVRAADFPDRLPPNVVGLHFHTLCEQNADSLERTLAAFEDRFGRYLDGLQYVNFGGGHHVTRPDYDVDLLVGLVRGFREKYGVEVYLEPGEAVVLNAGYLVTTVLDVVQADVPVVIMDAAVPCHMPDVIEMPYRPEVVGAGRPGEKAWDCRLAGPSCLAGDVAGDYSFDSPLEVGQRVVFTDMALYTMVKTNTFNGIKLPDIAVYRPEGDSVEVVRTFGYEDFKGRLG